MPEVAVHAVFGREVLAELDRGITERIRDVPYTFALFGPDLWFMYQPWKPVSYIGATTVTWCPILHSVSA